MEGLAAVDCRTEPKNKEQQAIVQADRYKKCVAVAASRLSRQLPQAEPVILRDRRKAMRFITSVLVETYLRPKAKEVAETWGIQTKK